MEQAFEWIKTQLGENEFFKGGFILLVIGSIGFYARRVPTTIFGWIQRLLLVTVSFDERTTLYQLFQSWINDQGLMSKKRDVMLKVNDRADPPEILIVPDRKSYLIRMAGVWCRLSKKRDDEGPSQSKGGRGDDFMSMLTPERFWLTCFVWNRKKILDILHYIIREYGIEKEDSTPVYQYNWGYWGEQCKLPLRSAENLVLREGQLEGILQDVREFLDSRDWYEERQVPYQRGFMLCGPPGTGKTTLASTLASHFKMRLCILDFGSIEKDSSIKSAFASLPSRPIVLIEDFDSFFQGRKMLTKDSKLTFSGLLNAINGVVASPGRLLLITTNVVQDIDPALLRAGRIDRVFKLNNLDDYQAKRIVKKFVPGAVDEELDAFCSSITKHEISPADLVGHLQKHRRDMSLTFNRQILVDERNRRLEVDSELKKEEALLLEEKEKAEKEVAAASPDVRAPSSSKRS